MKEFEIRVSYDGVDNAGLIATQDQFLIASNLGKVNNPSKWIDDSSYGMCHRQGISFKELLSFLPAINERLGCSIRIESECKTLSEMHRTQIDNEDSATVYYEVWFNDSLMYRANTYIDGCLDQIRNEVIQQVARIVYFYGLFVGDKQ